MGGVAQSVLATAKVEQCAEICATSEAGGTTMLEFEHCMLLWDTNTANSVIGFIDVEDTTVTWNEPVWLFDLKENVGLVLGDAIGHGLSAHGN